jgi:anion-transporting  ArsA/GET3 family ATPase
VTVPDNQLQAALDGAALLICIGSGGVGKTTTSAALALRGALGGRRTLVLTIDPARRLLQALGLDATGLQANTPLEVLPKMADTFGPGAQQASLHAMMLDPASGAEAMVARLLDDPSLHEQVLGNRIYRALLPALSAAPDYVALELIADLHASKKFDLIVLDTPPAHNTMDFLRAGSTFSNFINERVIRFFSAVPGASGKKASIWARSGSVAMRLLGRLFGSEVLPDIATFFYSFRDVMPRMKARNNATDALMRSSQTRFISVTAPGETSLREAHHMRELMRDQGLPFAGFVVNRVVVAPPGPRDDAGHLELVGEAAEHLQATGMSADRAQDLARRLGEGARHLQFMERADAAQIAELSALTGRHGFCAVAPQLEHDIHTLSALSELGEQLVASVSSK